MRGAAGQHLFQYVDLDGAWRTVTSDDVNQHLGEAGGADFTAKISGPAARQCSVLRDVAEFDSETEAARPPGSLTLIQKKSGRPRLRMPGLPWPFGLP